MKNITVILLVFLTLLLPAWASPGDTGQVKSCGLLGYIYQITGAIRRMMEKVTKWVPDYSYGPKKHNEYDPNIGYEVYWPDGEWVFKPLEKKPADVCGERCNVVYEKYGYICARSMKTLVHRTFENYCKMRDYDCEDKDGWLIAYRGKCAPYIRTIPTVGVEIATRINKWLGDFSKRYPLKNKPVEQLCVINYKYYHVHGRRVTTHLPMVSRSRGRYYSPDFGYEVYWPGGEWVQFRDPDLSSTTQPPMVCGRECHYLYRDIKKVCGRHDDNRKFRGCWNYGRCTGYPPDYYEDGYQTFDTYCQFLDRECRSGSGSRPFHSPWFFVHLGACERQQNRTFKPMFTDEPVKRMKFYLTSVADTFKKLGRTPCEEPKIIRQIIG